MSLSSVPKDMAIKAPIVVLGKFHEWVQRNNDLKDSERILSRTEELIALLRSEAT